MLKDNNTYLVTEKMRLLIGEKHVVVGVSGGVDSMYLITQLLEEIPSTQLVIAHVHHGLREESDEEYEFVKSFALKHGIKFRGKHLGEVDFSNGSIEKTYRDLRYTFYENVLREFKTDVLALGHHADDLAELVLMRLVNGASGRGLIGMSSIYKKDNNTIVLRPLLNLSKEEIYEKAHLLNIEYREDATNKSNDYLRNRYRNNVIPLLREENQQLHKRFIQFSKDKKEEEDFIDEEMAKHYKRIVRPVPYGFHLNKIELFKLHIVIQRRILKKLSNDLGEEFPPHYLLELLKEKVNKMESSDCLHIFGKLYVVNDYQCTYIFSKPYSEVANPLIDKLLKKGPYRKVSRNELKNLRIRGKRLIKYVREKYVPKAFRDYLVIELGPSNEVINVIDAFGNIIK